MTRRSPEAGEVEIRVHATGLNFRDVLNALGMYPGDAVPLGIECSGGITAVGPGVEDLRVGDAVLGVAPGCFSTFVTTHSGLVVKKPPELSFEDAAAIPSVFLTVYFSLYRLAKMSAGERVLIHAAAGGVGLAAVQLAQRVGAEIFATVGTPEKAAFLKSLGVEHVMSSRSLDFADEVMNLTAGEGVDIVLNSLAGEFIPKGLSLLRANGRFLELGKRDIWDHGRVADFRKDIRYFIVELAEKFTGDRSLIHAMLTELMGQFREGTLRPLPLRLFRQEEVADAFRFMAQAGHIGKIIVSQHVGDTGRREELSAGRPIPLNGDASYLVTGGLGGLGLQVARWMVRRGARHLILMGRSEASAEARETIERLNREGAEVVVVQGDVSRVEDVARAFGRATPPLRGIVHCAGILDDGVLLQQGWDRFAKVMSPKVAGTWNLHLLSRSASLDFFIICSAFASLIGAAGQGNYTAACAFQDLLAHYRRAKGLPATSINWGSWSEVGMAARGRADARLHIQGISSFTPDEGVRVLERLIGASPVQSAAVRVNWPKFIRYFYPECDVPRFFELLLPTEEGTTRKPERHKDRKGDLLKQLQEAMPAESRKVLQNFIQGLLIQELRLDPSFRLDSRQGLKEIGVDSLMNMTLRNHLQSSLGHHLPSTLTFDYPTIEALVDYLLIDILHLNHGHGESPPCPGDTIRKNIDEICELSEEEAETLLLNEMDKARRNKTT